MVRGSIVALLVGLGLAPTAHAEEPRVAALSWMRMEGAEGCMSLRDVAAAVEARLARRTFVAPADAELFVEGRIEPREEGGYRATVSVTDADGGEVGTRELEEDHDDCRAIDESIVLVVSAVIDPEAALRASAAPATAAESTIEARDTAEIARALERPQPECPDPVAPEPRATWRAGAFVGGVAAAGVLPGIALGLTVHVDVTPPGLVPIEIGATAFRTTEATLRDGNGAELSLAWGEIAACPELFSSGAMWLRGCAGAQLGAIGSRGFGFDRELDDESLVANAVVRVRFAVRVAGPLALSASAGVGAPLVRHRFHAREATGETREVFQMAPALGLFELAIGGDFF